MKTETKKQIELLKKYGVTNYTVEGDKITANRPLYLSSLTSADKDFLKGTTINGSLYLDSLTSADKEVVRNNVKKLEVGYNKKGKYCFFDGILSKVLSIKESRGFVFYCTPFGYISQKDKYTAHGNTIKKATEDLKFKIISEKLKNEPIKKDTVITIQYYRLITGACEQGCKSFIQNNKLKESYKASELLVILEKSKPYGFEKFKSLLQF